MYTILETAEYKDLAMLFYRHGLEVSPDEEPPEGLIKLWELIDSDSGKRIGGVKLEKRNGQFVVAAIAVEETHRRMDLGTLMLEKAVSEVRSLCGESVWLVAKVPEFFKSYGFAIVDFSSAPAISKCMTCNQFKVDCFPEVMRLDLK